MEPIQFARPKTKVYIKKDTGGRIFAIGSETFISDLTGWEYIDEGCGDRYVHAQNNYLPGPLCTQGGIPRYKLDDGEAIERTAEEIEADRLALPAPPTEEDKLKTRLQAAEDALLFLMDMNIGGMP